MVTRTANTQAEADLFSASGVYGVQSDVITLAFTDTGSGITVWTGGAADLVKVSINPTTGYGYTIFTGAGNDTVSGSSSRDMYVDQSGNDSVNLSSGNDWVRVGKGDDTYIGGAGNDSISFTQLFGDNYHPIFNDSDVVSAPHGVSLNLSLTGAQDLGDFGKDKFSGFENIYGTDFADTFHGNSSANVLWGNGGTDYLSGREGNDILSGGTGGDILIGGAGADEIYTGDQEEGGGNPDGSNDVVKYTTKSDSTLTSFDTVFDFETSASGGGDKFDLSLIDANVNVAGDQAFVYRGTGAFISSGGEIRIAEFDGATYVVIDTDADADAEMMILVQGVTDLTLADFIL